MGCGGSGPGTVVIARDRVDVVSVTLYFGPYDATSTEYISLLVSVSAIGTGSIVLSAEHGIDPCSPNPLHWAAIGSSVSQSTAGTGSAIAGGQSGGSQVPMGPSVRIKAVVTVTAGAICWSGAAVFRG
jgi:hypothetical protein